MTEIQTNKQQNYYTLTENVEQLPLFLHRLMKIEETHIKGTTVIPHKYYGADITKYKENYKQITQLL